MTPENYAAYISRSLTEKYKHLSDVLFFGENINQGSYISGLAKGLDSVKSFHVLNVGNCELTHAGLGFGSLIDGGTSILIVKQLDFLLLALDQLVNSYNWIRAYLPYSSQGSFTIYSLICDQGFQGPQSSFNNVSDFASIANIEVFCLNTAIEIDDIISRKFVSPGFRIVCLSQKYLGCAPLNISPLVKSNDLSIFKYLAGDGLTILCYNFTLRYGIELASKLSAYGITCDLFHLNYIPSAELDLIVKSSLSTNKVLLMDDTKSVSPLGSTHLSRLHSANPRLTSYSLLRSTMCTNEYGVHADEYTYDFDLVLKFIKS